ncbi:probable tRNA (uracil-O(2)-)-methyltransferase [Ischnura elegans]|uniref:probable tRNA (uracil-O(2)-)-methyltransferase n=1 Tax=Ischnura elegans TaxID=197161 RepID=UPI001ED89CDE|nr:probable tRNA (uracil-O(2)-)-methyltransferase [Ischnura elegans]XP_046391031.1 probable tRNA (uracil-O(2)-)-methyltransferase [Ischnura elegans]XP_046391032.1 probable tRNA (uracil-O(2)-)-methyltransferase [Ischnura elegans]XP_046391033.1 probable tRNA (uracil-O(2)-)-methyltransferase [Ischnura elegans]
MPWVVIEKTPVCFASEDFWRAVEVWDRVPHVVNRRLAGVEVLFHEEIATDPDGLNFKAAILKARKENPLIVGKWEEAFSMLNTLGTYFPPFKEDHVNSNVDVILKKLMPKNPNHHAPSLELEILEHDVDAVTYATLTTSKLGAHPSPPFPYKLTLVKVDESFFLELKVWEKGDPTVAPFSGAEEKSILWLKTILLPKFSKWAVTPSNVSSGSLKLISVANYGALYQSLKNKYAAKLMDLWPENTDPQKFIHEDLGIAAYLLLLWEQERCERGSEERQSFVDIGCGNGLLVYILTEEGHPGLGIDIRSRKIWDIYPPSTKLKVCTIHPSEQIPFPAVDWLIGNHSDELTPWIPVFAAMIPGSRYFVLPCCPHDFFGRYGRKNPGKSVYQEYLEFVQRDVSETLCKFATSVDRLRIPSTKRVCIIGSKRLEECSTEGYKHTTPHNFLVNVLGYSNCSLPEELHSPENGHALFVPRPSKERVRNCTKVDPHVITEVVSIVAAELLTGPEESHTYEEGWDCGRTVPLETLAKLIPSHLLEKLKNECGGLQTLLKNNHFIFKVSGGMVTFRRPHFKGNLQNNHFSMKKNVSERQVKSHWKSRPCWFHTNHPSGCPLLDAQCSYIHSKNEEQS